MYHTAALASSLVTLALVLGLYFAITMARRDSILGGETVLSILIAGLTGMFPLAATSAFTVLAQDLAQGLASTEILTVGADAASVGMLVVSLGVFALLLRLTRLRGRAA